MNEKSIEAVTARLVALGFAPAVETVLRCNVCFAPDAFDIFQVKAVGADWCQFAVHLEKVPGGGYEIKYYVATLRKPVIVPAELTSLNVMMESIDWNILATGKNNPVQIATNVIQTAAEVMEQLSRAGNAAEFLKYKFWVGTSLEPQVQHINSLKAEWEISERFYLFDESDLITFAEAVRFLNSRWKEKQMTVKKKLLVKRTVEEKGASGVSGGRLLTKNPRKAQRRIVDRT
jgi:hypothetical protein